MAPSSEDKESKYDSMSYEELIDECKNRKINYSDSVSENELIELLIKNDMRPPDWGKIFSRVIYHTGMGYEEIPRRTIPQIMAILEGAEENIPIKIGVPNVLGDPSKDTQPPKNVVRDGKPPKLSEFMAFANMFNP